MSITDELREYADEHECYSYRKLLDRIADRIDERHERALADAELCAAPTEAQLSELGYVKLPKDADGVPIKLGDIVGEFEVRRLVLIDKDTWDVEDRFGEPFNPSTLHHTVPDSWEDIIADALKFAGNGGVPLGARFADYTGEFVERCRRLAHDGR